MQILSCRQIAGEKVTEKSEGLMAACVIMTQQLISSVIFIFIWLAAQWTSTW